MTNNPAAHLPSVLVTRPRAAAERFTADLVQEFPALQVVVSPIMAIIPIGSLPDLGQYQGVIFTSSNAVEQFSAARQLDGYPCFCVGDTTAAAAQCLGFKVISAGGNSRDLVSLISDLPDTGPLVHVRGVHSKGDVAESLSKLGRSCDTAIVYDQIEQRLNQQAQRLMERNFPMIIPIFSPRSAQLLIKQMQPSELSHIVAISQAVAEVFAPLPDIKCSVAEAPNYEAMLHRVLELLKNGNPLEPPAKRL